MSAIIGATPGVDIQAAIRTYEDASRIIQGAYVDALEATYARVDAIAAEYGGSPANTITLQQAAAQAAALESGEEIADRAHRRGHQRIDRDLARAVSGDMACRVITHYTLPDRPDECLAMLSMLPCSIDALRDSGIWGAHAAAGDIAMTLELAS
jgi:hypothetical protein